MIKNKIAEIDSFIGFLSRAEINRTEADSK